MFLSLLLAPPPNATLLPYTTLFRSAGSLRAATADHAAGPGSAPARSRRAPSSARRRSAALANRRSPSRSSRAAASRRTRSEEHTSELQSPCNLVCRLLLEKKHLLHDWEAPLASSNEPNQTAWLAAKKIPA